MGWFTIRNEQPTNDAYAYESISFDARSVTGLLWEAMDALVDRLRQFE
ncbi:MAG: hypothetical protein ACOCP3_02870 [Halodesulfurarchaeum sp.]